MRSQFPSTIDFSRSIGNVKGFPSYIEGRRNASRNYIVKVKKGFKQ